MLSDATELHALQTQLARARSVTLRFDRIKRSVSGQARALKWEFIGEITVDGSVKLEAEDEEDDRRWFWSSSSASGSVVTEALSVDYRSPSLKLSWGF